MEKLKVLCLSFWTPPAIRPQSILIGKMIPEWINQGIEPVIITYETGEGNWNIGAPIYKIPQFRINKLFSRILPLRRLAWHFYYHKICGIAMKIVKKHGCKIIFSFANPQDSNIVGAMVKKNLGIKFVSHFSDPWYDNAYKSFSKFTARRVLKQEKFIIEHSDKVIFTNKEAQKLVMKKYPAECSERAAVIPHCYDLKDYPEINKDSGGKFIISYIGAFYKQRNPELLFAALKNLIAQNNDFANKFQLKLVGAVNDYAGYNIENINDMAEKYDLKKNLEILPVVTYKESLKLMKLSNCLVVIDANVPDSPFLPSKVVDYAGSGSIVVGISPTNSPTDQFLKNLGYESFSYNQIDELGAYLKKIINREVQVRVNQEFLKHYDVKNTTSELTNIFKETLNK